MKFVVQYCGYLGIKCIAVPLLSKQQNILCQTLNKVLIIAYVAWIRII